MFPKYSTKMILKRSWAKSKKTFSCKYAVFVSFPVLLRPSIICRSIEVHSIPQLSIELRNFDIGSTPFDQLGYILPFGDSCSYIKLTLSIQWWFFFEKAIQFNNFLFQWQASLISIQWYLIDPKLETIQSQQRSNRFQSNAEWSTDVVPVFQQFWRNLHEQFSGDFP